MQELIAADYRRAGLRMSVLFYGLGSILVSSVFGALLLWFTLKSYTEQNARVARLAVNMTAINTSVRSNIADLQQRQAVLSLTLNDAWTRNMMIRWCIDAAKENKGFKCPAMSKPAP